MKDEDLVLPLSTLEPNLVFLDRVLHSVWAIWKNEPFQVIPLLLEQKKNVDTQI